MPHGYLTPEEIPATFTRRWICVPDDLMIVAAVNGALLELTFPYNWELYGAVTPDEITAALLPIVLDFQNTEALCMRIANQSIFLSDEKAQNTNGGTFTSGAFQTRTLNTSQGDDYSLINLASNQFTVPAGEWLIEWSAPAYFCNAHQTLLYDVTNSVGLKPGTTERANTAGVSMTRSFGQVKLSLASPIVMELRHRCQTTRANDGFGIPANFQAEVYALVKITPLS